MKYLYLSFMFIFSPHLFGQQFPLPEDNPLWTLSFTDQEGEGDAYITVGDSISICDKTWISIFIRKEWQHQSINTSLGHYRKEGQRYYYRASDDCEEKQYLLYDFGAEIGDTLYIGIQKGSFFDFPDLDTVPFIINQIDTVHYGGIPRRRINQIWVEGIGDLRFPFIPAICPPGSIFCEISYALQCLAINDTIRYVNSPQYNPLCNYIWPDLSRIYVDQSASKSVVQDGSSWENAFSDLQQAIEVADAGDSIWVAAGVYYPSNISNRNTSFWLNPNVKIFGGFSGVEQSIAEREIDGSPSILSGNIGDMNSLEDNSYHVVYTLGTDSNAVLDGFTIREGYAIHPNTNYFGPLINGGGLLVDTNSELPFCTPTIRNCRFEKNTARFGGGVYCNGNTTRAAAPNFENCQFFQNRGEDQGGAIFKSGGNPNSETQAYTHCLFEENWAKRGGAGVGLIDAYGNYIFDECTFKKDTAAFEGSGGIYFYSFFDQGEVVIDECTFEDNYGEFGGAFNFIHFGPSLIHENDFKFKINQSTFKNNRAANDVGGAMSFVVSGDTNLIKITNTLFEANIANSRGGAISVNTHSYGTVLANIQSCVFKNNRSISFPAGGAISFHGDETRFDPKYCSATISNSLFYGNRGAFLLESGISGDASTDFFNCTFYENGDFPFAKSRTALDEDLGFTANISFTNSIIWEPTRSLSQIFLNGSFEREELYGFQFNHSILSPDNCNILGGDQACGEGMIFGQYPIFVDTESDNFQLAACSPAVNRGHNGNPNLFPTTDLNGQLRILEDTIDIGAFEREKFNVAIHEVDSTTCFDSPDGAVQFSFNGDDPYTSTWKNSQSSGVGSVSLLGGDYTFVIVDGLGCQDSLPLNIPSPAIITPYYTTHPVIDGALGAIILDSIQGGRPPYQFNWDKGETSHSLLDLLAGDYSLSITDQNDCMLELDFSIPLINATNQVSAEDYYWELFPNPVKQGSPVSIITHSPSVKPKPKQILIYDANGKLVRRNLFKDRLISLEGLSTGVYWALVIFADRSASKRKLIVVD